MKDLLKVLFILALFIGAISFGCARFNECRRVHPLWYCATDSK